MVRGERLCTAHMQRLRCCCFNVCASDGHGESVCAGATVRACVLDYIVDKLIDVLDAWQH
jgi:hypothetical protein